MAGITMSHPMGGFWRTQPADTEGPEFFVSRQLAGKAEEMSLDAGTRLGPYEIQSPLGAGGMEEVYRATRGSGGR
jgi:hypothetical protein